MFSTAAAQSWSQYCGQRWPCVDAAHDDGERRLLEHARVGVHGGDRGERGAVGHHDEAPGLLVAGRGRRHGGPQQTLDVLAA